MDAGCSLNGSVLMRAMGRFLNFCLHWMIGVKGTSVRFPLFLPAGWSNRIFCTKNTTAIKEVETGSVIRCCILKT